MMRIGQFAYVALFVAVSLGSALAQPEVLSVGASQERLKQHVYTLASEEFAGREVGKPGQLLAANYCIRTFRQNHLTAPFRFDSTQASFRQPFAFTTTEVATFGPMRTYNGGTGVGAD